MKKLLLLLGLLLLIGCSPTVPPVNPVISPTCGYDVYNSSPFTCDNSTLGCQYGDTVLNTPCYCNGSSWISTFNSSVVC